MNKIERFSNGFCEIADGLIAIFTLGFFKGNISWNFLVWRAKLRCDYLLYKNRKEKQDLRGGL